MGRGGRENNVRRGLKALWVAELEEENLGLDRAFDCGGLSVQSWWCSVAPGLPGHPPSSRAALVTPAEGLPVLASATVFVVRGPACSAGSRKWVNFSLGSSAAVCLFFHTV